MLSMEDFGKDLRFVLRGLMQAPQFTISVILVLGLAIGVTSSMFGMVNAYRFRSAPVKEGNNLITLASQRTTQRTLTNFSYPNLKDVRERNSAFTSLVGYAPFQARVRSEAFSERFTGQVVTGDYFQALGVLPAIGRLLNVADDTVQATPAVVISHYLWERYLAFDKQVIGATLFLNGRAFILAGVAQDGFRGTDSLFYADLWVPVAKGAEVGRAGLNDRTDTGLRILGYLRPNVSLS